MGRTLVLIGGTDRGDLPECEPETTAINRHGHGGAGFRDLRPLLDLWFLVCCPVNTLALDWPISNAEVLRIHVCMPEGLDHIHRHYMRHSVFKTVLRPDGELNENQV